MGRQVDDAHTQSVLVGSVCVVLTHVFTHKPPARGSRRRSVNNNGGLPVPAAVSAYVWLTFT